MLDPEYLQPIQPDLWTDVVKRHKSIEDAFQNFHTKHPEVYEGLVRLAYQADRDRLGIKMLFEVLRWEWIIRGLPDTAEEFKLNNNYTSRYARLIMETEPGLKGVFETRRLTT